MDVGTLGHLAADLVERLARVPFGRVALAQLLPLSVDSADIDGELVADDGPSAGAAGQFDAFDLRRQLAALNHRSRPHT